MTFVVLARGFDLMIFDLLFTAIAAPSGGAKHHEEDIGPELQAGHRVDALRAEGELLHRVPPQLLLRRQQR